MTGSTSSSLKRRCCDRVSERQASQIPPLIANRWLSVDPIEVEDTEDVQEQLEKAERELLEARATYSLQRKAIEAVLMTEPTVQSVHAATKTPIERYAHT